MSETLPLGKAQQDDRAGSDGSWPGSIVARPELPSALFLLALFVLLSIGTDGFLTAGNIVAILEQAVIVAIVALALNQVILSGEIDVSVGSLLAVCAFVYGNIAMSVGGVLVPLAGALAVGAGIGLVNGFFSTYGRIPSIITTLGTLFILRGLVLILGGAQVLNLSPDSRVLGLARLGGLPVSVILTLAVLLTFHWVSRNTDWGRNVFAVGGNPHAARTLGLPVERVRLIAFVLTGAACGLAAAVLLGQIGQLQATAGTGFELRAIAAVVLGGTSIKGGKGSVVSPVIGALLVGVILNAMTLNRIPGTYELLVLGALILGSVSVDGIRQRLSEKGR